jgi:membrane protease YdiL (CAAX protease family)
MSSDVRSQAREPVGARDQRRWDAAADIVLTLAASGALYGLEMGLQSVGLLPESGMYTGAITLVGTLAFVVWLVRWRGQRLAVLGLRRPHAWWFVPAWGLAILVVNVAAQLTLVPALASVLHLPAPDVSQYDVLRGNLGLFVAAALGAMFTGGFIEEVLYRGLMVDRLARIFGGGRRGELLAAVGCGVPFGLIHFEWGLGGIFLTAVMGAVQGLMYLVTRRNLWPLVAAHAGMDFILLLQAYLGTFR